MKYITRWMFSLAIALSTFATFACSCMPHQTPANEYNYYDVVIAGRIIAIDTFNVYNELTQNKKGFRFGKHKYNIGYQTYLRVKIVVTKKYKSPPLISDTCFVITSTQGTACGYPFGPLFKEGSFPDGSLPFGFLNFIIYARKLKEYSVVSKLTGKKEMKYISETQLPNTFITSTCSRTQSFNEEEDKLLDAIKRE